MINVTNFFGMADYFRSLMEGSDGNRISDRDREVDQRVQRLRAETPFGRFNSRNSYRENLWSYGFAVRVLCPQDNQSTLNEEQERISRMSQSFERVRETNSSQSESLPTYHELYGTSGNNVEEEDILPSYEEAIFSLNFS